MKGALLLFALTLMSNVLFAQYVFTIKADSVKITNCDSAELIIENHTQGVPGFLYNTGNGRTIFKRALQKVNDSVYLIGTDTLKLSGPILASNGLQFSGDTLQLGGTVIKDTKVDISPNNSHLWIKTSFKAATDSTKTGQVFIGDTDIIRHFISDTIASIGHWGDDQENAALIVSKTKENNNENVDLLSLTTADAPGKNGFLFQNYTNVSGLAGPTMQTYSNAGASTWGYTHNVISKSGSGAYKLNFYDYDSLNLNGHFSGAKLVGGELLWINNGPDSVFAISGNEDIEIGGFADNGEKLQVYGGSYFSDSVLLNTVAAGNSSDSVLVWNATTHAVHKVAQSSISGGGPFVSNGISYTGDTIQWGGTLSKPTQLITNGNMLWIKVPFRASEDTNNISQVFIGDSNRIHPWNSPYLGQDHQNNAALIISKTKENNSENVDLLSLTTTDAPGKNGFAFLDYTNASGLVQPKFQTFSTSGNTCGSAYQHDVFGKANSPVMFQVDMWDYDSANAGSYVGTTADLFAVANGSFNGFYIDNNFDVGVGGTPAKGTKLDVMGTGRFSDTLKLPNIGSKNMDTTNLKPVVADASGNLFKTSWAGGSFGISVDSVQSDTSGGSVTIGNKTNVLFVDPSSALSSLSIVLPAVPHNSNVIWIHFGGVLSSGTVVTTLTINANSGQALVQSSAPNTAIAGQCISYRWRAATSKWYREN